MSLKKTTSIASVTGVITLIFLTVKFNLRSIDHLITGSVFEMFSSSSAFQLPPYNGTLINPTQFFYYIHAVSAKCQKIYSIEGRSCHKQSDTRNEICLEDYLKPTVKRCVIYSIGVEEDLPFEDNMFMAFECETHIFDPSTLYELGDDADDVTYHPVGGRDGLINATALKAKLRQLSMRHPKIDVVKLDLWGQEWKVLELLLEENVLGNVHQLTFTSHLDILKKTNVEHWNSLLKKYLDLLLSIEDRGLKKVYYSESRNTLTSVLLPAESIPRPTCGKFLYIKSS